MALKIDAFIDLIKSQKSCSCRVWSGLGNASSSPKLKTIPRKNIDEFDDLPENYILQLPKPQPQPSLFICHFCLVNNNADPSFLQLRAVVLPRTAEPKSNGPRLILLKNQILESLSKCNCIKYRWNLFIGRKIILMQEWSVPAWNILLPFL